MSAAAGRSPPSPTRRDPLTATSTQGASTTAAQSASTRLSTVIWRRRHLHRQRRADHHGRPVWCWNIPTPRSGKCKSTTPVRLPLSAYRHECDGGGRPSSLGARALPRWLPIPTARTKVSVRHRTQQQRPGRLQGQIGRRRRGHLHRPRSPGRQSYSNRRPPLRFDRTSFIYYHNALNDNGEIAFRYNLANGISGIAVARPDQPLAGDYNLNGTVDAADYVVWRKNTSQSYEAWRTLFGQSALSTPVDFNNDGTVDAADYVIWRKTGGTQYNAWRTHFGEPSGAGTGAAGASPSQAAVPEPATLVPLMFAAAGWCLRRRRGYSKLSMNSAG